MQYKAKYHAMTVQHCRLYFIFPLNHTQEGLDILFKWHNLRSNQQIYHTTATLIVCRGRRGTLNHFFHKWRQQSDFIVYPETLFQVVDDIISMSEF